MIRVHKDPVAPRSLSTTNAYDGQDVHRQLETDQHKKCYLCERTLWTDFQVEHHKSKAKFPHLKQDWKNLFWGCGYCNNKKLANHDALLLPTEVNVEDEIKQVIDFSQKKASFTPLVVTPEHINTVQFLEGIYNGLDRRPRTKREERFFEYIIGVINSFLRAVNDYLLEASAENEAILREMLQIDKECLGFKYWIVKSNPLLSVTFAQDIIWNKR